MLSAEGQGASDDRHGGNGFDWDVATPASPRNDGSVIWRDQRRGADIKFGVVYSMSDTKKASAGGQSRGTAFRF